MKTEYLVISDDMNPEFYDQEDTAELAAEVMLHSDPNNNEVVIYKQYKVGRRQSILKWEKEEEAVPRETPSEPIPPERPPYQGPNKRWTDDERAYLKEARSMGMSFEGIAKKLGRSKHAVELKYSRVS